MSRSLIRGKFVGVADRLYGPVLIYHQYIPDGAAWNWQTACGRELACFEPRYAIEDFARPCIQCEAAILRGDKRLTREVAEYYGFHEKRVSA